MLKNIANLMALSIYCEKLGEESGLKLGLGR